MLRAVLLIASVFGILMLPQPALAADVFSNQSLECNNKNNQSAVCQSKIDADTNPIAGKNGILARVTNIVTYIAGIASIILIILGGIRFITSEGDPNSVKSARNTVFYALIGILVILVSRALILYVIGQLNP